MKTVLTIAGSDPSGGAGLQSDLNTISGLGLKGLSAVTALTAQTSTRVAAVQAVGPAFLRKQVSTLLTETVPDAVKIGMIGTGENARAISWLIKRYGLGNVVLDTVLKSTGGHPLFSKSGGDLAGLMRLSTVVTPNIPEAEALTGLAVKDVAGMEAAARMIKSTGVRSVLVKGGHLAGEPVDVLFDGDKGRFFYFRGKRLKGGASRFHGTGCILSSAIAVFLARGYSVKTSVERAREYLLKALRSR